MKKILFVSTRYPFPLFGGDKIRAFSILKFLSKKNQVDFVCIANKEIIQNKNLSFCKNIKVFHLNFLIRIVNIFLSFFKLEPLQTGYYLSKEMKNHINNVKDKYDTIICHHLRSSQYIPDKFKGIKILEKTDLLSLNYEKSIKQLSLFNPLKYIYILEKLLVERYEKKIFKNFHKIIFVSNLDAQIAKKKTTKNNSIHVIGMGNIDKLNPQIFKYSKSNSKVIFIGNIKYLPNKLACKDFIKNVLKKINLKYPEIKFHIIGDIRLLDKIFLNSYKNVIVNGKVKNLKAVIKNSICGLCNVKISTGFQNKILTYMNYGIPAILSVASFNGTKFKKNKEVLVFRKNEDLIEKIIMLKENKKKSNQISRNSKLAILKKYDFDKILSNYNKVI